MTQLVDVHPKSEWAKMKFEIGDDEVVLVASTWSGFPFLITLQSEKFGPDGDVDAVEELNLSSGQWEKTIHIQFYTAAHQEEIEPEIVDRAHMGWLALKDDCRTLAESLLQELDRLEEKTEEG
jgi:hypothetical protein